MYNEKSASFVSCNDPGLQNLKEKEAILNEFNLDFMNQVNTLGYTIENLNAMLFRLTGNNIAGEKKDKGKDTKESVLHRMHKSLSDLQALNFQLESITREFNQLA